ncbi:MAG: peptidoglycan bridge formation glycyltransferase FemA/FemB family protein [Candidatus Moranbacteria bacterium]|nr:peptidoglycan bridge formation glycyltransferase FemA/FemB family protein [Candidatus Moranbacteria bacterium]
MKSVNQKCDELLQSEAWMRFQEAAGHRVVRLCGEEWSANGVVHRLPLVGEYLYVPRGPRGRSAKCEVRSEREVAGNRESGIKWGEKVPAPLPEGSSRVFEGEGREDVRGIITKLLAKAKEMNVGWIRIEPETEEALVTMRKATSGKRVVKAPHDMQPRETFVVDLAPTGEELLAAMKPKTRYNIGVAKKRGVSVVTSSDSKYVEAFIRLVMGTADRKGIVPHPKAYYEAMCVSLLDENGKIFAAEKDGEIIAANVVVFHGNTATYLHGGSDEKFRADMAPFCLQWESMREAKRRGCAWYDFGGVSIAELEAGAGKWLGITRFKTGFSPLTSATVFPGSYDVVLSPVKYYTYRMIQGVKSLF